MLFCPVFANQNSRRSTSRGPKAQRPVRFRHRDENLVTATPTSALFHFPYPATPLFATLTKTTGVYTNNSHSGTPYPLSPFFLHSCELFCTPKNLNPFLFYRFRTLSQKHPGVGYLSFKRKAGQPSDAIFRSQAAKRVDRSAARQRLVSAILSPLEDSPCWKSRKVSC